MAGSDLRGGGEVAWVGLGAMGSGMARTLLQAGVPVAGFDVNPAAVAALAAAGGRACGAVTETVAGGAKALVVMVATAAQAESVLYGPEGALQHLQPGALVILTATVPPAFARETEAKLGEKGVLFLDAPVSGGTVKAGQGKLTIMAGGSKEAWDAGNYILEILSERLYNVGRAGDGSAVKMVNQVCAGVHIATAAEAMAFGARSGLNTRMVFDIISNAAGSSWMFQNRVPHMLDNDFTPHSAVDIWVKDLGIVLEEARSLNFPLPLASTAHQQYLLTSAAGMGRLDDAAVVKVFETMTGAKVASVPEDHGIGHDAMMSRLPSVWPRNELETIRNVIKEEALPQLIVLDDDPTGTQTVNGIDVLTEWSVGALREQLAKEGVGFFILTNSRAFQEPEAVALTQKIVKNVAEAARDKYKYSMVLRGDSTLRGHFPAEVNAVTSAVQGLQGTDFDATIICPFFFNGGRFTINDVHYVKQGAMLVPAGFTEFAKDATFGYTSSDLKEWVEEKTRGEIPASSVHSISLQAIRQGGPAAIDLQLEALQKGSTIVVNAACDEDMYVVCAGIMRAEKKGKRYICRTAASFVSARMGITPIPPIKPEELSFPLPRGIGGLVVVGSHVPKTKAQVEALIQARKHMLNIIEIDVSRVVRAGFSDAELEALSQEAVESLKTGRDVLIMTSRKLVTGADAQSSLNIANAVSKVVVFLTASICKTIRPRFLVAKGGITSSDVATKALEAKSARVIGQAGPGLPLWVLAKGSVLPNLPYIVFPGNVGGTDALLEIVKEWTGLGKPMSTAALLKRAAKKKYGVGAFNIYNLEGAKAIVRAAEKTKSPAIIQLLPSAFQQGSSALLSACKTLAKEATVPITVHLDHCKDEVLVLEAINAGFDSILVDGSHLPYAENAAMVKRLTEVAHEAGVTVEAELGIISGVEDNWTVSELEACMTDPAKAASFVAETHVDMLAVCVGNIDGKYPPSGANLDMDRLQAIRDSVPADVPLVMRGVSGLGEQIVKDCIGMGCAKFNVNTEVHKRYLGILSDYQGEATILDLQETLMAEMAAVMESKMELFGSVGQELSRCLSSSIVCSSNR